jgi:DNA mismatch repair ATPase MutS
VNSKTRIIIFALFSLTSFSHIIFPHIDRDLEIEALYEHINHTKTTIGAQRLHGLLSQPTNELKTLQARQNIIAYIVEHDDIHTRLSALLNTFAQNEKSLEQIAQPSTQIEKAFLENLYFSHDSFKKYNHDPAYLELGQVAYLGNLCSSLAQHALTYAIFTWGLNEEHVCINHPAREMDQTDTQKDSVHTEKKNKHADAHPDHENKKKHTHEADKHTKDKQHAHQHHHDKNKACSESHDDHGCDHPSHASKNVFKTLAQSKSFRYAFQLWHVVAQVQELYSIQSVVRHHLKCIGTMQDQLISVATSIRTLKKLHAVLEKHPEISSNLPHYQELHNVCRGTTISPNLKQLLALLATKTFSSTPSIFSRIGIILAAYKLVQEVGNELQPALNAVAELDVYLSCAKLVKNHQSGPLCYCFASYQQNSTCPLLEACNFWHPLAQEQTIVLNSISLGSGNHPRNIIITGPNASGKSTSLKEIILCAYLAQTLTIVPAEKYSQTMYKEIYSSMVVSDNIRKNMSLFVTEINDAEELLTRVNSLEEGEYMLIALDELFKSTSHEKGQSVARKLLQHLYACPQIITLTSTHFSELSALADEKDNRCANYTLDHFKLIPGVNSSNPFDIIKEQKPSKLL